MKRAEPGVGTGGREHEMRIGVRSQDRRVFAAGDLAAVVNTVLVDWHVAPLFEEGGDSWLISGYADDTVGTAGYAKTAHTLVQSILATGTVAHAEADIPVTAFDNTSIDARAVAAVEFPPGSESSRWARDAINCDAAWAVEPGRGSGIRIGHPDTGYTLHPNLGREALDLASDLDLIDDDDDALDPLIAPEDSPWPMPFPGHGTTTASVMVGRGSESAGIVGVAPGAKVVPIRAVESVVQLFDSDVARAVEHARLSGCHVGSMSLGGKGFFGLREAIQRAVDDGMIVMAAAGNNVRIVVAPASYSNCVAVAATGPHDEPWPESSRGRAVDVSAPGWGVHIAGYTWKDGTPVAIVGRSSGTSYAVTHLAGVAALWFAHHGPDALRQRYGSRVQAVFVRLMSEGSRVPDGWDQDNWGAGIVDAAAMLAAPLPEADTVMSRIASHPQQSALARLSALVSVDESELARALSERLDVSVDDLHQVIDRFEGELAFHLIEDEQFRSVLLDQTHSVPGGHTPRQTCSPQFAAMFG